MRNYRGELYKDYCGDFADGSKPYALTNSSTGEPHYLFVRGDCLAELETLMISYLVVKPLIENATQLATPWAKRQLAAYKRARRRRTGKVGEAEGEKPNKLPTGAWGGGGGEAKAVAAGAAGAAGAAEAAIVLGEAEQRAVVEKISDETTLARWCVTDVTDEMTLGV